MKQWDIKRVVDPIKNSYWAFIPVLVWLLVQIVLIIIFSNTTQNKSLINVLIVVLPLSFLAIAMVYIIIQLNNHCIFELEDDRLTQKFLKKYFGKFLKDSVFMFSNIKSYRRYYYRNVHYFYINLKIPDKPISISVRDKFIDFSDKNPGHFVQFLDAFESKIKNYNDIHPEFAPIERVKNWFEKSFVGN